MREDYVKQFEKLSSQGINFFEVFIKDKDLDKDLGYQDEKKIFLFDSAKR